MTKKVIDGKMYDTATADEICRVSNSLGMDDFDFLDASLYRTDNGRYFIAGDGGAASVLGVVNADRSRMIGLNRIVALTEDEARSYVEKHADAETFENCFGAAEAA